MALRIWNASDFARDKRDFSKGWRLTRGLERSHFRSRSCVLLLRHALSEIDIDPPGAQYTQSVLPRGSRGPLERDGGARPALTSMGAPLSPEPEPP